MSRALRVLIVDDEPPARDLLRAMLAREGGVSVVGEASDGREAVGLIRALAPDLVLLDVQMPELDGFGVIDAVGPARMPAVIFVTAYDRYALRAFEVHALDYLLKPYDRGRLVAALRHAAARLDAAEPANTGEQLAALLEHLRARREYPARLPVRREGRVSLVDVATVDWIEAADKLAHLHAGKAVHTVRSTLGALEQQLDPARFIRIHRSTIVNADRIREIQPWFQNDYVVLLADGTKLMTGRAYRGAVRRLMGEADA